MQWIGDADCRGLCVCFVAVLELTWNHGLQ